MLFQKASKAVTLICSWDLRREKMWQSSAMQIRAPFTLDDKSGNASGCISTAINLNGHMLLASWIIANAGLD